MARPAVPRRLLRDFFPVDDELLAGRYREALAAIGAPASERTHFHVDAAGYSPEIAGDLGDPHYLGAGVLRAHAIVLAVEQLRAPLVHPGLGFAADAYRETTGAANREIASITLREPLIVEVRPGGTQPVEAHELADPASIEIQFRTPGGLVRGARRLAEMKQEFLESSERWLDDAFIEDLRSLAREVRDLGSLPERFGASQHALGPFYAAAFGGSYVLEESGRSSQRAPTWVLAREPGAGAAGESRSARGRRVVVEKLDAGSAAKLLESHGIARLDSRGLRRAPDSLAKLLHWIAVAHLLEADPDRKLPKGRDEIVGELEAADDAPSDFRETSELLARLRGSRGRFDPDELSPLTRLRLLSPTSTRKPIRRFVRHLQAGADPVHLGRTWQHAPDVFFERLVGLPAGHRRYFARWLESGVKAKAGR